MVELLAIEEWPYVLVLTDQERAALDRDDEVAISMFDLAPELLRMYYGEV